MDEIPRMKRLQGTDWLSQLPEDVLWKTLVLLDLDLPTLYTARLVCQRFRKTAAGLFKALDCTTLEELPTTDFTQFSSTTYLALTISHESHLQSLLHPRIAPVVTHVSLKGVHFGDNQAAEELEAILIFLPKLRLVSLRPLVGDSHLPLFPPTLEELEITDRHYRDMYWHGHWGGLRDASPLTRYSQLTSLAIDLFVGAGTSMGSLSGLRNLRCLNLRSCYSAIGVLSTFTALTSLTFEQRYFGEDGALFEELGRLTGLSRLALLMIFSPRVIRPEELACIAQLTNLTCLDVTGCTPVAGVALSTALVALTRLVSVRFNKDSVLMPYLSLPQLESLHSLGLGNVCNVSSLASATGLTHLGLSCRIQESNVTSLQGFCPAVAGMSRLRSLEISVTVYQPTGIYDFYPDDWPVICLAGVLQACTALTKLAYRGELQPDRDLEACASLPGLRSLVLEQSSALNHAWLPALQAMSDLTELSLLHTGICAADMTPDVIAAFDAERRQLGWPLVKLRVETWNGGRYERL